MAVSFVEPTGSFTVFDRSQWLPKIKSGYFFMQDRRYYLYAKKYTTTLKECSFTKFSLPHIPVEGTVVARVSGIRTPHYSLQGNEIIVQHINPSSYERAWDARGVPESDWESLLPEMEFNPDDELHLSYDFMEWDDASNSFVTSSTEIFLKFANGQRMYALPSIPQDHAPVVITDDSVLLTDQNDITPEFSVNHETGALSFNINDNAFENPSFEELTDAPSGYVSAPSGYPDMWLSSVSGVITKTDNGYHGRNYISIDDPAGYILQRVDITELDPYTVSYYARNGGSGMLSVQLSWIDPSGMYMDASGVLSGSILDSSPNYVYQRTFTPPTGQWSRDSFSFGHTSPFYSVVASQPSGVSQAEVRFEASGKVDVDAMQMELGYMATDFWPMNQDSTIEYELDPDGFFIHQSDKYYGANPTGIPMDYDMELGGQVLAIREYSNPFPLNEIDYNSANVENHAGFLHIVEHTDPPGTGVVDCPISGLPSNLSDCPFWIDTDPSGNIRINNTTDWHMNSGGLKRIPVAGNKVNFLFGRRYLPYAKVDGKGKFRHRGSFGLNNEGWVREISTIGNIHVIDALIALTPRNSFRDGSGNINAVINKSVESSIALAVVAVDASGNVVEKQKITVSASDGGTFNDSEPRTDDSGKATVFYTPNPSFTGTETVTFTSENGKTETILVEVI